MIPKTKCPTCNHELFDYNPIAQPVENDTSICIYCGAISIFQKNLQLRKPNKKDKIDEKSKIASRLIRIAIDSGLNMEQFLRDQLIKSNHIKSH